MNFYPHHIGDFNNATRHLTRIERSVYRDMIDLYYDTEEPLTMDTKALCRKLIARTDEESTAVQQVLNEFFTETEQGWHHSRCESEINAYRASITAKSVAGKASAAKREQERKERLEKLNGNPTVDQQPLDSIGSSVQLTSNHEPVSINQEPLKTKDAPSASVVDIRPKQSLPDWLSEKAWNDWVSFKGKKLTAKARQLNLKTLTGLHADGHDPTAVIEQSIERGWTGLFPLKTQTTSARGRPDNLKEKSYVGTDPSAIDWM